MRRRSSDDVDYADLDALALGSPGPLAAPTAPARLVLAAPQSPAPLPAPALTAAAGALQREERAAPDGDVFTIVALSLRLPGVGGALWTSPRDMSAGALARGELEARLPASVLRAAAVSRAVTFHCPAAPPLRDLAVVSRVLLRGAVMEEMSARLGPQIPNSVNTWEATTEGAAAAGDEAPLDASELSGHVQVETVFTDRGALVARALVRVFYE